MAFEVENQYEIEDRYVVTLLYRPQPGSPARPAVSSLWWEKG